MPTLVWVRNGLSHGTLRTVSRLGRCSLTAKGETGARPRRRVETVKGYKFQVAFTPPLQRAPGNLVPHHAGTAGFKGPARLQGPQASTSAITAVSKV
jgi:hypothetical protein